MWNFIGIWITSTAIIDLVANVILSRREGENRHWLDGTCAVFGVAGGFVCTLIAFSLWGR